MSTSQPPTKKSKGPHGETMPSPTARKYAATMHNLYTLCSVVVPNIPGGINAQIAFLYHVSRGYRLLEPIYEARCRQAKQKYRGDYRDPELAPVVEQHVVHIKSYDGVTLLEVYNDAAGWKYLRFLSGWSIRESKRVIDQRLRKVALTHLKELHGSATADRIAPMFDKAKDGYREAVLFLMERYGLEWEQAEAHLREKLADNKYDMSRFISVKGLTPAYLHILDKERVLQDAVRRFILMSRMCIGCGNRFTLPDVAEVQAPFVCKCTCFPTEAGVI